MSTDEKERAIGQYNRQRAKSRRKAAQEEHLEQQLNAAQTAEIEPLVNEPEPRSRRARKAKQQEDARAQVASTSSSNGSGIGADHPILKRKRVQRDLSQVIFGPTQ